ncbi:signal peptidase II [Microbacterium telephonicum]|uniref:Lipoprotein signal peptidase n=1 Tax=Microbacterium telephonicum TaxID=1714841 RepID=A0A498CBC0_9MICO|nr:signal peptidase II [Microbacterium telephonicum]RLK49648.1 signal peptidase II [Microbacterium telephonicum]
MAARKPLRPAAAGTLVAVLAILVLAADQFAKHFALENLPYQEPVAVWGDFLQFYLTRNPGAAFSLGEGVTWVFTLILAAAAVTIVVLAAGRIRSRAWAIILGLLLGGILGNLTDRLIREPGFLIGHVIDFINTPWMWTWLGMNPAIYNIADMFIVTMMIGVAVLVLVGLRFDGTRELRQTDADAEAAGTDPAVAGTVEGAPGGSTATDAADGIPPRG